MISCAQCGQPLEPEDRFCGACGSPRSVPPAFTDIQAPVPPSSPTPAGKSRRSFRIATVLVVLIFLGAAAGVVYLQFHPEVEIKRWIQVRFGTKESDSPETPARPLPQGVLSVRNTARYQGVTDQGRDFYEWTAYVDGPQDLLDQIRFVRYDLGYVWYDVEERAGGFALTRTGRDEITLKTTVFFNDGRSENLSHRLVLADKNPRDFGGQ